MNTAIAADEDRSDLLSTLIAQESSTAIVDSGYIIPISMTDDLVEALVERFADPAKPISAAQVRLFIADYLKKHGTRIWSLKGLFDFIMGAIHAKRRS